MRAISRRAAVITASLLAATACGAADESTSSGAGVDSAATSEMVTGNEDASVTIVEYASWTCPACLQFQKDVVGNLKEEYVETGKVKFIFRELPTPPQNISVAGFAIARCAGPDQYFDVVDELFSRQNAILTVARQGGQVKSALQQVASNYGIDSEEEFDACLNNADIRKAIAASVAQAREDEVSATPTVYMNGEELSGSDWRSWDGMQAVLNEALGEDAPEMEEAAATETPADTATDTGSESAPAEDGEMTTEPAETETPETDASETEQQ